MNINFDEYAKDYIWWAYCYYELDNPVATDNMFDTAATLLYQNYNKLSLSVQEYLTKEDLLAGTFLGEYPAWVYDKEKK